MRRALLWTFVLACLSFSGARAEFFIQDGDVVCFWGNSITDYGVYPRMIENYVVTHYPDWNVKFVNLGWGGDRTMNVGRLRRDIQLCQPTKVLVMLGMNDGEYKPFDPQTLSIYLDSLKTELDIFRERSHPQIMLISATPYDLRVRQELVTGEVGGKYEGLRQLFYPSVLERYAWELGRFAQREGCSFVDLNRAFTRYNERVGQADGSFVLTKEGVHPNIDGQLVMGLVILDGMQAPTLVAESSVDAAAGKVVAQDGCTVSDLKAAGGAVSFTRLAGCLPLPIYPSTRSLTKLVLDYPDLWDRDILKVSGLAPGWYSLALDGRPVDILDAASLADGVNLSRYACTPQMIQACKVFEETEKRMSAFYTRWRSVLLEGVGSPRDFKPFKNGVETSTLETAEQAAFEAQHKLNKPVTHTYEIKPVPSPLPPPSQDMPAPAFLSERVKLHLSVDASSIPGFRPPLSLQGNVAYAPQYQWGIIESRSYYSDIPVLLYDDGTHGDAVAGDRVWSLDIYLRQGSGKVRFALHDGPFDRLYWNPLERGYYLNPWCEKITRAWDRLLGGKGDDWLSGVDISRDVNLVWDKKAFAKALDGGLFKDGK